MCEFDELIQLFFAFPSFSLCCWIFLKITDCKSSPIFQNGIPLSELRSDGVKFPPPDSSVNDLAIVTLVTRDQMNELRELVGSVHHYCPNCDLVIYGYGLFTEQVQLDASDARVWFDVNPRLDFGCQLFLCIPHLS
jgi:hypothetical protein